MSASVLISSLAAGLNLMVALFCATLSRTKGWQHLRLFAGAALFFALFALMNALFLHRPSEEWQTVLAGRLNIGFSSFGLLLWLQFSRHQVSQPSKHMDKILSAALTVGALVSQIPMVALDGIEAMVHMGDPILIPRTTASALIVFGFVEIVSIIGGLDWPFLSDIGFSVTLISVSVDVARRATRDTEALYELNQHLEERVKEHAQALLDAREALLVAERHRALGDLAQGVGHEINNPLAIVSGSLDFIRNELEERHSNDRSQRFLERPGVHWLGKPLSRDELLEAVWTRSGYSAGAE